MPDPKGDKLFVNLGPSKVRKRLAGFGHGVRKVQTNGRNQSVIIHTATGQHLRELEAKFADVGFASRESDLSEPIENLQNLGPTSALWLRGIGISTIADLQRVGPVAAFQIVRRQQPGVSLNLLWAMVAGLRGFDWRELSTAEKARLREQVGLEE